MTKTATRQNVQPEAANTKQGLTLACKAASDSLRIQILRVLKTESFGVLELCQILELAQPKLSHHLKVLANAKLVATRREGNSIFYRRPLLDLDAPLSEFIQVLFKSIDSEVLDKQLLERISAIKAERSRSSLDFFAKNAGKFSEMQELITENSQYVINARDLIETTGLPKSATAVEIGPGQGNYLPELSQRFSQVYAVDNSEQMLAQAQQLAAAQNLKNVDFILGEPVEAIDQEVTTDLVVCHMVLHHIPSPQVIFDNTNQLLKPSGFMLVAELCHHDQDWVKSSCGDLWLGFEPEELKHWAKNAGLLPVQDLFLGLRNGFQVQLHLFKKSD